MKQKQADRTTADRPTVDRSENNLNNRILYEHFKKEDLAKLTDKHLILTIPA